MKQSFTSFAARMNFEDIAAKLAQILKPWTQVFRQLLVDLAA